MDINRKSRILIRALRHDPSILNLTLDKRGWTTVNSVLKSLSINTDVLDLIVSNNNKSRFEYNETKTKIRASQGHSIKTLEVFKDWNKYTPTHSLYHGTPTFSVSLIMRSSLNSKTRTHVHLSKDIETAYNVGKRHGNPVILEIDAVKMDTDGYRFYESKNGVILIDEVPAKYISALDKGQLLNRGFSFI